MSARTKSIAALLMVSGATLLSAAPASANHHFISVTEVYPGSTVVGEADNEFVELQMYAAGQTLFTANSAEITIWNSTNGFVTGPNLTPDPANGANQATILIGTPDAGTQFGMTPDYALPAADNINPLGGAVCFASVLGEIDCVSWGNFDNTMNTPHAVGINEPAIPNGSSIHRSIAPNCPTALDQADDSNDSATDFAPGAPSPRNNTQAPAGTACTPPTVFTPPGNPTSPINPAGNVRKRKCKKKPKGAAAAKKKKCKKR